MIDLDNKALTTVKSILKKHLPGIEVRVFGSRVTGQAKQYSDLDLVVMSKNALPMQTLNALLDDFSESDLVIMVDVIDWNNISDQFREIINQKYEAIQNEQ